MDWCLLKSGSCRKLKHLHEVSNLIKITFLLKGRFNSFTFYIYFKSIILCVDALQTLRRWNIWEERKNNSEVITSRMLAIVVKTALSLSLCQNHCCRLQRRNVSDFLFHCRLYVCPRERNLFPSFIFLSQALEIVNM